MKVRVIQLIKNYFKDQSQNYNEISGSYCTFGYFDALEIEENNNFEDRVNPIWDTIDEIAARTLNGTCTRRNIICITEDEEQDEKFWEEAEKFPYLFVSLIRIKHLEEVMKKVYNLITDVKAECTVITYYSYDHSELVMLKLANSYSEGMNFVLDMRKKLYVLNMYSVFSVRQDIIDLKNETQCKIGDEKIDVRLRLTIKEDKELDAFLQKLWETLRDKEICEGAVDKSENFDKYYILGSRDMIVEIGQVGMKRLLLCYSKGELLTYSNVLYSNAVYNTETEIICRQKRVDYGYKCIENECIENERIENEWIENYIYNFKKLHNNCKTKEIALARYLNCMIRLLNALAQMSYSQFHYYEKGILWNAMEIFSGHFIKQVERVREEKTVAKKRILIDDIENSVEEITGVFRNVIDSTANTDRQMLSNISINTSIYELSPKICMFYSIILDKLVEMFKGDKREYVFILHPTLKNNTETKIMFRKREESGKVVIIYISESIIEKFDVVTVFLFHEAFHVLTKKERLRKKRMESFLPLLFLGMEQMLLENIVFDTDQKNHNRIKEKLISLFFDNWVEEAKKIKRIEDDSREFYGNNVGKWGIRYCQERLEYISEHLESWITEEIWGNKPIKNYEAFMKSRKRRKDVINGIRKNISNIIYNQKISSMVICFLSLYREIYADIACILTLQLLPDDYEMAFEQSQQFGFDKNEFQDSIQEFRKLIVAEAVAKHIIEEKKEMWEIYQKKLYTLKNDAIVSRKRSTLDSVNVIINIKLQIHKLLFTYANCCAEVFNDRLSAIVDIDHFRKSIENVRGKNNIKLLKNIMMGDFEQIFM